MVSIKLSENGGKAPEAVPYMPAGLNHICCTVNGRAGKRAVMADRDACERLNADLQELLEASKAGNRARPVVLFDHKSGPAAAEPVGFEWDEQRGILLRVNWTSAGREAVEGGNYGYISPAFRLERGTQRINGLQGGVEVGSLVNDPAFERNECIAAGKAELTDEEISDAFLSLFCKVENTSNEGDNIHAANGGGALEQPKTDDMETIKTKLGLAPDATPADVAAAIDALMKKCDDGKKRIEEVEAENHEHKETIKKHKESAADAFVKKLRKEGKVSPHDEETLKAAREAYLENPERTELIYASFEPIVPTEEKDEKLLANRITEPERVYAEMSIADCYATINF
jgi:phage I-like protein